MRRISAAILIGAACYATALAADAAQPSSARSVNEDRARSAGIRKLTSRHLILYTDLVSDPEIDRLPAVFDEAVPQWAEYFHIESRQTADWRVQAYLIGERRRFDALGLMPAGHDNFINGISIGNELWLHDQPTAYYRRHLLLHEGTHVFMNSFLGGCGPGWFMEGTAELLATHRLKTDGQLTLRIMPGDRSEVPMLGRIKLIRDAVAADRELAFPKVLQIDNRQQLGNEAYAWCWAASKFLDAHPRYREQFRALKQHVANRDFNNIAQRQYSDDWSNLLAEWQAFVAALDHGYDFERTAIEFQRGKPLGGQPRDVSIAADRGWQSSGVWLEAGKTYDVKASGRYQIAEERADGELRPWPCEPGGVTIEYHDGHPLGMLLGAIDARKDNVPVDGASLADAFPIGLGATITPVASGTLYLRVNDSPARLDDNRGELNATVELRK